MQGPIASTDKQIVGFLCHKIVFAQEIMRHLLDHGSPVRVTLQVALGSGVETPSQLPRRVRQLAAK